MAIAQVNQVQYNRSVPINNTEPKPVKSVTNSLKNSVNAQIIQHTVDKTSVSAKNNPLQLLYSAAVDQINQLLSPELGENSLQSAIDSNIDVSPEATAERIVSLATGFFSAYQAQHKGEDSEETLNDFLSTIRGGVEQGFSEAREILAGLQVLEGDIASNIDKTYELVMEGLTKFEQNQQESTEEKN